MSWYFGPALVWGMTASGNIILFYSVNKTHQQIIRYPVEQILSDAVDTISYYMPMVDIMFTVQYDFYCLFPSLFLPKP